MEIKPIEPSPIEPSQTGANKEVPIQETGKLGGESSSQQRDPI